MMLNSCEITHEDSEATEIRNARIKPVLEIACWKSFDQSEKVKAKFRNGDLKFKYS